MRAEPHRISRRALLRGAAGLTGGAGIGRSSTLSAENQARGVGSVDAAACRTLVVASDSKAVVETTAGTTRVPAFSR